MSNHGQRETINAQLKHRLYKMEEIKAWRRACLHTFTSVCSHSRYTYVCVHTDEPSRVRWKAILGANRLCCGFFPFSLLIPMFENRASSVSFPMCWLFTSGGQSIGASASASASVLPMIVQGWFPLGLTVLIFLLSKRLSRIFSTTTIQKHQFFSTRPSSNSHICT